MKYLVVYRRDVSFPSASQRCGTLRFPQTAFSLNHPLRSERVADERSEVPLRGERKRRRRTRRGLTPDYFIQEVLESHSMEGLSLHR